jgi:hypothetical protein
VQEIAGLEKSNTDINVLFSHPAARVTAFSLPINAFPRRAKKPYLMPTIL